MKKDQNLPKKNVHSNNSSGKPPQIVQIIQETNRPITLIIEVDHQNKEIHENSHKTDIVDQIAKNNLYRNNYSRSNSNRREFFDTSAHSHSRNRHYSNDRSGNSSYNRNRNYSNNRNRSYSNNRNQRSQNNRSRNISYNRSKNRGNNNNYYNRSRNNSQNRNPNYKNRRNYSQSPYRNTNRYPDSQHKYGSNTPKLQRQINQVQTTEETISDPPGIDSTKNTELQLNHINCESTDSESDTENTISTNMIKLENDYETVIYEQPLIHIFIKINQSCF